jgi:hypothetical protein
VLKLQQLAVKAGNCCGSFEGHFCEESVDSAEYNGDNTTRSMEKFEIRAGRNRKKRVVLLYRVPLERALNDVSGEA